MSLSFTKFVKKIKLKKKATSKRKIKEILNKCGKEKHINGK